MAGLSFTIQVPDAATMVARRGGDLDRDMERRARRVEAAAKVNAPVDTGRLRASGYTAEALENSAAWDVIFPVHYAWYVDQGTRFMRGRFYLTDALPAAL